MKRDALVNNTVFFNQASLSKYIAELL